MPSSVATKLQIRAGQRVAVVGAPRDAAALLGALPDGAALVDERDQADAVLVFVASRAHVEQHAPRLAEVAARDGLAWAAYPKRSSGVETELTRDVGWDAVTAAGLRPVRQVAIDETWSALRFRTR